MNAAASTCTLVCVEAEVSVGSTVGNAGVGSAKRNCTAEYLGSRCLVTNPASTSSFTIDLSAPLLLSDLYAGNLFCTAVPSVDKNTASLRAPARSCKACSNTAASADRFPGGDALAVNPGGDALAVNPGGDALAVNPGGDALAVSPGGRCGILAGQSFCVCASGTMIALVCGGRSDPVAT